jgi:hypothetical protein
MAPDRDRRGATIGRLSHPRGVAYHDDPAHRFCSGCRRNIRRNRRLGLLLRPHLNNHRRRSGRTFVWLGRRLAHVGAGSPFPEIWGDLLLTNSFVQLDRLANETVLDWNHSEDNSKQFRGDLAEDNVGKIVGHQKVRRLEQKQREALISESWDVVSFWAKVFAFSGLLMAQLAAFMMGRIYRSFQ